MLEWLTIADVDVGLVVRGAEGSFDLAAIGVEVLANVDAAGPPGRVDDLGTGQVSGGLYIIVLVFDSR